MFGPLEEGLNTVTPAGILLLGLVIGLRHAFEADHIAAVSIIVTSGSRKWRSAPLLGALWGIGHTATLLGAGAVVLFLAVNIPERVSNMLEFGVGAMLVFLGASALTGFSAGRLLRGIINQKGKHAHVHFHHDTGILHSHEHGHESDHHHGHKSVIVGMIHGLAGSGALMLAVLSTINSIPLGLAYIAIFGAGSIASMAAASALIGLPIARARRLKLALILKYAAALAAVVIGAALMYELGYVEKVLL
jgi:hypothetical protein